MVDLMYHHGGTDCLWFAQAEEESQHQCVKQLVVLISIGYMINKQSMIMIKLSIVNYWYQWYYNILD